MISSFDHKAKGKNLSVKFTWTEGGKKRDDRKLIFTTDPEKLYRVIANLLANAIEFNHAGKQVMIDARTENNVLQISITDEGTGIPEQERSRLFERFHQLDQGSSKKHKGHGLGLSITKALVGILGGKVSVAQAEGGGCVFKVAIPQPETTGAAIDEFSEDGNEFLFENGRSF
jgi:signal transduction histidine kinase